MTSDFFQAVEKTEFNKERFSITVRIGRTHGTEHPYTYRHWHFDPGLCLTVKTSQSSEGPY